MAARIRAFDWAATPLGPIEQWPWSLKTVVDLMLATAQPVYIAWGPDNTSLYNDGYIPILDAKHPAALGLPFARAWAEIWAEFRPIVTATMAGEPQYFVDRPVPLSGRPDHPMSWFTFSWAPVRDESSAVAGFYCVATETTDRVLVEATLRDSEERQAFLLKLSDALRPLVDPITIQSTAARLLGEHLGASRAIYAEIATDDAHFVVHRDYVDGVPSFAGRYHLDSFGPGFVNALRAGHTVTVADTERDARVSEAERAVYASGKVRAFVAVPLVKGGRLVADLSLHHSVPHEWSSSEVVLVEEIAERTWAAVERARVEAMLRDSEISLQRRVAEATTELRALSRRLLSVQEEERRYLARELHDEIGQTLTGLGFQLGSEGAVDPRRLTEARRIVRELTDQVRQLSMDLRPAALDRYGLLPTLQWHVERLHAHTGLTVDFGHEGIDRRFPGDVEITAYRIVQEALTNVARHAETNEAAVRVLAEDDRMIIVVRDAGRGFDIAEMGASKGFGGMRERVALLGGTLAIDAAPGEGTVISAELPLDENEPETREES